MLTAIIIFAIITIIVIGGAIATGCRDPQRPIMKTEMTMERGRDGNLHNVLKIK